MVGLQVFAILLDLSRPWPSRSGASGVGDSGNLLV
jgi:hypothetical protein